MAGNSQKQENEPVSIERRQQRRGIYLLPNLITTAALLAGFYSIVNAMRATPLALWWRASLTDWTVELLD